MWMEAGDGAAWRKEKDGGGHDSASLQRTRRRTPLSAAARVVAHYTRCGIGECSGVLVRGEGKWWEVVGGETDSDGGEAMPSLHGTRGRLPFILTFP